MPSAMLLLDGRVMWGAYGGAIPELPPPNPELALLEDGTGLALLTSPAREYLQISIAPIPGLDFVDPDAVIFYYVVHRGVDLDSPCTFEWRKIGTLPNDRLKAGFPIEGVLLMTAGQTQLPIPLVLESRADLGQGYTLGVQIFSPVGAVIDDDSEERVI